MTTDYDSILTSTPLSPVAQTEFYATGAHLPDTDVAGLLRTDSFLTSEWLLLGMVLLLGVLIAFFTRNFDYFNYRLRDFFATERRFNNLSKLPVAMELPHALVLTVLTGVSLALILYTPLSRLASATPLLEQPYQRLLLVVVAVVAFVLLKAVAYMLVNWAFFPRSANRKWMSAFFFLTSFMAYPIFLVAVLFLFAGLSKVEVAFCLLFLLILYEFLLFYKLVSNFQSKKYGVLLFFLYFCAVEIAPTAILWHFFHLTNAI